MLRVKKYTQFLLSFLQWNDFLLGRRFGHFRLPTRCVVAGSCAEPFSHHRVCFNAIRCRTRFQDWSSFSGSNWNVFLIGNGFEDCTWCWVNHSFAAMHTKGDAVPRVSKRCRQLAKDCAN